MEHRMNKICFLVSVFCCLDNLFYILVQYRTCIWRFTTHNATQTTATTILNILINIINNNKMIDEMTKMIYDY